jgi:hypothetical protein
LLYAIFTILIVSAYVLQKVGYFVIFKMICTSKNKEKEQDKEA